MAIFILGFLKLLPQVSWKVATIKCGTELQGEWKDMYHARMICVGVCIICGKYIKGPRNRYGKIVGGGVKTMETKTFPLFVEVNFIKDAIFSTGLILQQQMSRGSSYFLLLWVSIRIRTRWSSLLWNVTWNSLLCFQDWHGIISSTLASLMLLGLSSLVAIALVVQSDLVPKKAQMANLSSGIRGAICVSWLLPILFAICSPLIYTIIGKWPLNWWLESGSSGFILFAMVETLFVLLFVMLFGILVKKLLYLVKKYDKQNLSLWRR